MSVASFTPLLPYFLIVFNFVFKRFVLLNYISLSSFIEGTLQLNPEDRPTVKDILDRLKEIAEARQIKLDAPLKLGQPVGSHPSSPGYFLTLISLIEYVLNLL